MHDVFHEGELAVQVRAGVASQAQRVGRIIAPALPDGADRYLAAAPILFRGGVGRDAQGDAWASVLSGEPGFIRVVDEKHVEVSGVSSPGDPLDRDPLPDTPAGFLAIDLATRQRFRFNGLASHDGGVLRVRVEEAFGNCPKYIQLREVTVHAGLPEPSPPVERAALTREDIELVRQADTFFIASIAEGRGVDMSHRGENRGSRGTEDGAITFRDFAGNNMFQTLGNLTADPRAGLLFVDFETGTMLQLSGRAEVNWTEIDRDDLSDTGRSVTFKPERVVRIEREVPLRWVLKAYSPFNPEEN